MNSKALAPGTKLQGGKYTIEKELGQGGFGITYLAENTMLMGTVAIKEFFFKDVCVRQEQTSHVTISTEGQREMVEKFKQKFIKEARNLFKMSHPHIVRILDIFEENDTAYFVMEYAQGGSLSDRIKRDGPLSEPLATRYIMQIAEALSHVHSYHINHLDVKPSNIMLSDKDEAILIDFGLSKQYDAETGSQTSTTPVGISEGYAPMEQYKQGGVRDFSPETDIYALGATFYMLLTGQTPPSASDVNEDGLSLKPLKTRGISQTVTEAIRHAMEPRKKHRYNSVEEFTGMLKGSGKDFKNSRPIDKEDANVMKDQTNDETTKVSGQKNTTTTDKKVDSKQEDKKNKYRLPLILAALAALLIAAGGFIYFHNKKVEEENERKFQNAYNLLYGYDVDEKDEEFAFKMLKELYDDGHLRAGAEIGRCYIDGIATAKYPKKAFEIYKECAEKDEPISQYLLSNCYEYGTGVEIDKNKAKEWSDKAIAGLTKAANEGDALAMCYLGVCIYKNRENDSDKENAAEWIIKSAELGCVDAMFLLANGYYNNSFVSGDYPEAMKWYKRAAEHGHAKAMERIACMYYQGGEGIERDYTKYEEWLRKSEERGNDVSEIRKHIEAAAAEAAAAVEQ